MPSLREIMAAKKAATATEAVAKTTEAVAKKPEGLKLRDPSAPEPGESEPLPAKPAAAERQLDRARADGEQVPVDYPCESASAVEKLWWQARHSLENDLAIWIDPEGEHAWLAVKPPDRTTAPLVLLKRLPLATNPRAGDPF